MVNNPPVQVEISKLDSEKLLEDMIVDEPRILSDEWMLIGRQVKTETGEFVDLLAIAPDASLILIELKKEKTSREVISQILDYASWLVKLRFDEIAGIYNQFKSGVAASLSEDFRNYFGHDLDEETINNAHQLVVVASSVDPRTERIIGYLANRIPINMLSLGLIYNSAEIHSTSARAAEASDSLFFCF